MSGVVSNKPETRSVNLVTNLTDKENYFVNLDTTNQDEIDSIAAGSTEVPYILLEGYDGSTNNRTGTIAIGGVAKLKLGGTVTANQFITSDGSGKGIACTADNEIYGAVALQNGVNGDIIAVKVVQGTYVTA